MDNPLDYEGVTVTGVCPSCESPCLADKFDGEFVCGKCGFRGGRADFYVSNRGGVE